MAKPPNRATEAEIGLATLQIAAASPNGVATFKQLNREIPHYIKLTTADHAPSLTRNNEELWEQLYRNIKSHSETEGNIICEGYAEHIPKVGYKITDAGRRYLKQRGL